MNQYTLIQVPFKSGFRAFKTKNTQQTTPVWNEYRFNNVHDLYLKEDNNVQIPIEICKKLNWNPGSSLWIEINDEKLSQVIIGKKLSGNEASKALNRLWEIVEGNDSL